MTMTSRANRKNFAIGFVPQTAKSSAGSAANARVFAAESVETDPQRQFIHPQGSTGALMKKDTFRHVTRAPIITARFMGARECLGTLLEMMCFGAPTVSNADLTEANDGAAVLSAWSLTGVRPGFNTAYTSAGAILYVKILTNVIYLYKDSGLTQLVAQGNCAAGSVTLAAQGNSGLSGTVTCSSATPADDADITLTINTVTMNFSTTPAVYWTCFVDDGNKLRTYADCVLKSLKLSSENNGPMMVDVVLWAMEESVGSTALASNVAMNTIYAHNGDLAMRNDLDGTPVTQDPVSVDFNFDRDCAALFGTSAVPQDIYSKLIDCTISAKFEPTTEINTLLSYVNTWKSLDLKFTNGTKILTITFDKATLENPKYPGFSGDDVQPIELKWNVVEETAESPANALPITWMP